MDSRAAYHGHYPPFVRGATPREQSIVNRAFHLADQLPDPRIIAPLRDAVELIVELIERWGFEELYDRPHED